MEADTALFGLGFFGFLFLGVFLVKVPMGFYCAARVENHWFHGK